MFGKFLLHLFAGLVTLTALQGCSNIPMARPDIDKESADFYWPYAAIASHVYTTRGLMGVNMNAALASPHLRAEIRDAKSTALAQAYLNMPNQRLPAIHTKTLQPEILEEPPVEQNKLVNKPPATLDECNYEGSKDPHVPVDTIGVDYGWTEVTELHKYPPTRRWSFFVPDLAIDVWRRKLDASEQPAFEYAIVYRGTVGSGSWFTNLRGLAALTPMVWDQYRQAQQATTLIIDQIYSLHALSDKLFGRTVPTKITITAVGHSLGAGLAQYSYLQIPHIDKVVGFDPSPLNGASLIPIEARADVMGQRIAREARPTIFLLHEYGEALTRLAPCVSGPIWGDEGGPIISCKAVNLSHGNPLHQHNMPQLACKLYVARTGNSATNNSASALESIPDQQR